MLFHLVFGVEVKGHLHAIALMLLLLLLFYFFIRKKPITLDGRSTDSEMNWGKILTTTITTKTAVTCQRAVLESWQITWWEASSMHVLFLSVLTCEWCCAVAQGWGWVSWGGVWAPLVLPAGDLVSLGSLGECCGPTLASVPRKMPMETENDMVQWPLKAIQPLHNH